MAAPVKLEDGGTRPYRAGRLEAPEMENGRRMDRRNQRTYGSANVLILALAVSLLAVPLLGTVAGQPSAETWLPTDRMTHVGADSDSDFGAAVAVDGGLAVVGAPYQDQAYVYQKTAEAWFETAVLSGPSGFGSALAVDEGTIVVGAPASSSVHIYERAAATWIERLSFSPPETGCLGHAVAIDNSLAAAGDSCGTTSVYTFTTGAGGWSTDATLTVPENPGFGTSVDVDGERMAIGTGGAGYVFDRSPTGWTLVAELDAVRSEAIAVSGDTVVTGAAGPGFVEVFGASEEGWSLSTKLRPSDSSGIDSYARFGAALSMEGDLLAVGAPADDPSPGQPAIPEVAPEPCVSRFGFGACAPPTPGAAYLFERTSGGWEQGAKLTSEDLGDGAFGSSLALDQTGGALLVGAPGPLKGSIGGAIDVDTEDAVYTFHKVP